MSLSMGNEIKVILVLGITLFSIGAQCAPIGSTRRGLIGEAVFDVTQFGANGNGFADGSMAFIRAWRAACDAAGPVILRIPLGNFKVGKVVFNGPCRAHPIKIELQGIVLQTKDPSALSGNEPAWLINNVVGLTLTGGGTVNGQGQFVWKYNADGQSLLPISMMFSKAKFVLVDNVNFVNGKGVHLKVTSSEDVLVQNVRVTAPADSPNTDGIVISNSNRITVTDCIIATGDDCVAIGDTNFGINVSKITCGPGHGLSIGSLGKRLSEGDVKEVRIFNSTLIGTTNGVRIKTYRASHSLEASNIIFEDIVMFGVKNPVLIDQHYNSKKAKAPSKVHISDVHFINIRGTTISPFPVALNCSDLVPCEGVELRDINLVAAPESRFKGPLSSVCSNAKFSIFGLFTSPGCGGVPKLPTKN